MTARNVRSLALNMKGEQLFAATNRGVFKTVDAKSVRKEKKEAKVEEIAQNSEMDFEQVLRELSLNEPTIQQVQEAALRYAEVVHPDNIKALRRKTWLRGFLPNVTVDYDKSIQLGSAADKNAFVGPRDWGLKLSWDVGELLFSEQLRLVDTNARLAVQLRDDILNEVTRFYYERRKLQTELMLRAPKTLEDKLTQNLRLQELTANIDALTGSYFSRNLKPKKEKK